MNRSTRLALILVEVALYLAATVVMLLKPQADPAAPFRIASYEVLLIVFALVALGRFIMALRDPKPPSGSPVLLFAPTLFLAMAMNMEYR